MTDVQPEVPLEYNVLALSLSTPGAVEYFKLHLAPETLAVNGKGHSEIYEAMLAYHAKTGGDVVDVIAFRSWLESETKIHTALGGAEGVTAYFEKVKTAPLSSPEAVAQLIRIRSNRERQRRLVKDMGELVDSPAQLDVAALEARINEIKHLSYTDERAIDKVRTADEIADRADYLWDLPNFIPTQFPSLNKALSYAEDGGMCRGAVHAILAASGRGKSTMAKSLSVHWLNLGYKVLYINFEEAESHWERVLFTQITRQNIYLRDDIDAPTRDRLTKKFQSTLKEWGDRLMVEHNPVSVFFEDLEEWIRSIYSTAGDRAPDIIIIDTIQSMFLRSMKGAARWMQFEEMMVKLEQLAKETNAVILITAQENSNRMKDKREAVQQSDAGGALAIVQKCSVTIFITESKELSHDDSTDDNIMALQIPKNRITGTIYTIDPPLVRYVDEHKSYEPYDRVEVERYVPSGYEDMDFT